MFSPFVLVMIASGQLLACAAPATGNRGEHDPRCDCRVYPDRRNVDARISYRVLDRVTVSCPWLNPGRCEAMLRERACARGADVIVLSRQTIVGLRGPSQSTQNALLIRGRGPKPSSAAPR